MAFNPSPNGEMSENPENLRFTQLDIKSSFTDPSLPNVEEAIYLIRRGDLDPAVFGDLTVHRDKEKDGVVWCEDNRRLYVLRMAGVRSVPVKFVNNDYMSRRLKEEDKKQMEDENFMPRIRGERSGVQIPLQPNISGPSHVHVDQEQKEGTSLMGLMGAISAVAVAGYWGWKLLSTQQDNEADHGDGDGDKNKK